MFENIKDYNPEIDSKMPLKRSPFALVCRGVILVMSLLFSRHPKDAFTWCKSMIARRSPLSLTMPWLTFDAIRAISARLGASSKVFEFGSGHSTLYWCKLGAEVVSVDHDELWHARLVQEVKSRGMEDIVRVVFAADRQSYTKAIESAESQMFDLVLVDGAFRRESVLAAVGWVAPGGMLVVDNTDWHWFREVPLEGIPRDWEQTAYPGYAPMLGHASETTVWVRPK